MLKVTFCAYDKPDNVGGPVSWIQRLAPALKARGIEVRCLFIMHWGDTGPALASLLAAGIDCQSAVGLDTTEDRIKWILGELARNPPDVFVPNLVVAAYLASRWVKEAGIPTVGILHSDDEFYRAIQDEFVCGRPEQRVSAVACVSEELQVRAAAVAPASVAVALVPYGVHVPDQSVTPLNDGLRLAYVGRLSEEQKRISDVVTALCLAASRVEGVEATIFGDGPDRATAENVLLQKGAGLPVRFGGLVESGRIEEVLLDTDVIVLLSDYEGLPISLLEAMACGCVPVTTEMRSGIPELVVDGVTGLVVRDRGESFVAAIERLRNDVPLRRKLSRNARDLVKLKFSADRSVGLWIDLLERVARDRAADARIIVPRRFRLPPVNPALASADVRRVVVPIPRRIYRSMRMSLGKLRRSESRKHRMHNTVIVRISGGLANQMLCYKLGRFLAGTMKLSLHLDASPYESDMYGPGRNFQLSNYPLKYDSLIVSDGAMQLLRQHNRIDVISREMLADTTADGRKHILDIIRQSDVFYGNLWLAHYLRKEADAYAAQNGVLQELTLDPEKSLDEQDKALLDAIRSAPNPVAIHVRRGDFATRDGNLLLTAAYYNDAIKRIEGSVANPSFMVFSDDIAWCRDNLLTRSDIQFVDFHDDTTGYKDMYLASQCSHFILSNESTFSHQAVQLNEPRASRMIITSGPGDLERNTPQSV